MNVEGIHWVGVKTTDVRRMAEFFERVLGLRRRMAEDQFAILDLPGGGELALLDRRDLTPSSSSSAIRWRSGLM